MDRMLKERVTSANVSVGLGLLLESMFDITNRIDQKRELTSLKFNPNDYDYHIYNVLTVIREVISSMSGSVYKPNDTELMRNMSNAEYIIKYKKNDILNTVIDDLNTMSNFYKDIDCKIVLMYPDYSSILKILNKNKEVKTTKKLLELEDYLSLAKSLKDKKGLLVPTIEVKEEQDYKKSRILLTTHILTDFHYINGDLLETHTGKRKTKYELNTKYKSIANLDLSRLAFNKTLHSVFGDSTFVIPLPTSIRKEILELSIEKRWTPHTSEKEIKEYVKRILKNYKTN